jgi:hypothetical protein
MTEALVFPVGYLVTAFEEARKEDQLTRCYGAGAGDMSGMRGPRRCRGMLIIFLMMVLLLWPIVSAFRCGGRTTTLGLSGTAWGWILLVFCLLFPPIGVPLALVYLAAGRCVQASGDVSMMLSSLPDSYF